MSAWGLFLVFLLHIQIPAGKHFQAAAVPRVRPTDRVTRLALTRGAAHSPTFRALLVRLQHSDVVVHVARRAPDSRAAGMTQFVASTPHARYLRITLAAADATDEVVALLGHELQHAVEAAEAPHVADMESYRALYMAIGHASCAAPASCFDTPAAIAAGRQVLTELKSRRGAAHPLVTDWTPLRKGRQASRGRHEDVTPGP